MNVPITSEISVTFDRDMDPAFATQSNFMVDRDPGGGRVEGTRSVDGATVRFDPLTTLDFDKLHFVRVDSLRDLDLPLFPNHPLPSPKQSPSTHPSCVAGCPVPEHACLTQRRTSSRIHVS